MSKYIGPALPPHLQHLLGNTEQEASDDSNSSPVDIGPELPPHMKHQANSDVDHDVGIGPELPPHLKHCVGTSASREQDSDEEFLRLHDSNSDVDSDKSNQSDGSPNLCGPPLPPAYGAGVSSSAKLEAPAIGPALPPSHRIIGPALPPSQGASVIGPALPPGVGASVIGPALPSGVVESVIGPALPPGVGASEIGPALPPGVGASVIGPALPPGVGASVIGPALPPGLMLNAACNVEDSDDDSDDDVVGPMPLPEGVEANPAYLQEQMERRALRMKRRLKGEEEEDSGVVKRETWMLELPPDRANEFGLGPRQFRARAKLEAGDRSVWTDTPEEQLRKQANPATSDDTDTLDELQRQVILQRDRAMQKMTDKHNKKKRKESLVEMHQKKLRKKQKKEEEKLKGQKKERRPFDRDVDLQANRFDEAQKQAVLRKAQMLDDRFSRGKSKFL